MWDRDTLNYLQCIFEIVLEDTVKLILKKISIHFALTFNISFIFYKNHIYILSIKIRKEKSLFKQIPNESLFCIYDRDYYKCCVFRPAFGCCVHMKAGQNTCFCSFSEIFCWFQVWNHWKRFEMNKKVGFGHSPSQILVSYCYVIMSHLLLSWPRFLSRYFSTFILPSFILLIVVGSCVFSLSL